MKKLFVVDVRHTVYVLAEDEEEAGQVAVKGIHDCGDEPTISAHEVRNSPVPRDWLGAVPYGGEDEKTVAAILRERVRNTRNA